MHEELIDATIRHLAAIDRPSASAGEHEAAAWIAARLREEGLDAQVEIDPAHGGYWWPLGLACLGAGAAGLAGSRRLAAVAGALGAAAIWDDLVIWRHWTRRLVGRRRRTHTVVAEAGDRDAAETLVVVAHHDAAHAGLVFHPAPLRALARVAPGVIERSKTSPPLMWLVFGGPVLVALGAVLGRGRIQRGGSVLSLGSAAAFADIGARSTVAGANDNLTGVATVLGLARGLRERPVDGLRVLLVSTGSEESFEEGMQGFAKRWWPRLPRESTRVLVVDTVGSPTLMLLEREGMLKPYRYDPELKDLITACAGQEGVALRRGLSFSFGSDALIAVRDGYRTALLGSVDANKAPSNYHWYSDVADNVDVGTVAGAVRLVDATARALAEQARASAGVS